MPAAVWSPSSLRPVRPSRPGPASLLRAYNVREAGPSDGPVLLMIHGYGCDQSVWYPLMRHLAPDRRIVLMDLPGSGDADPMAWHAGRHGRLEGYAADVISVAANLDAERVTLVGHSVGATIAALAGVELQGLVDAVCLLAPSLCYLDKGSYRGGFTHEAIEAVLDAIEHGPDLWAQAFAPVLMGGDAHDAPAETWRQTFCAMDPVIARHFARVTFLSDHRDLPSRIRAATLVVQCTKDALVPVAIGEAIARAIPRGTYAAIDVAGHCPHLTAPARTAELVEAFLRRQAA